MYQHRRSDPSCDRRHQRLLAPASAAGRRRPQTTRSQHTRSSERGRDADQEKETPAIGSSHRKSYAR